MRSILQLFMKAPVPGLVKTRLCPPLSLPQAATVHRQMCEQLCEQLKLIPGVVTEVWAGGEMAHPFFTDLLSRFAVSLHEQASGDLGARMQGAFHAGLSRAERVVIVGGDCLSVDERCVTEALQVLREPDDAVLVPADDGGYVLVGVREVRDGLFDGVAWGSDLALAQTVKNFRTLGYRVTQLAPRWDIDTYADLVRHAPALLP